MRFCPVCKSTNVKCQVLDKYHAVFKDGSVATILFKVCRCGNCGHVWYENERLLGKP